MASKGLFAFTRNLTEWLEKNPGKKYDLREVVGRNFSSVGGNEEYRNNELAILLKAKTGYETETKLNSVIRSGKADGGGKTYTHIALYYLAKVDDTYRRFVPSIELTLFGKDTTFFDVFNWCPTRNLILKAEPFTQRKTHLPALGSELRLRPPGVHSHPSHFSNRAIEKIIGRDVEQEALRRFVSVEPGFRWLQLAGAGGQGKSRMAHDLMLDLGEAWEAGFLSKADLDEFQGKTGEYRPDSWRNWIPTKPTLIIIDYVIGREADIGFAMDQMADRSGEFAVSVRVLLVERQRWDRGGLKLDMTSGDDAEMPRLVTSEGRSDWFNSLNKRSARERRRNDMSSEALRFESGVVELESIHPDSIVEIVHALSKSKLNFSGSEIKEAFYRIDNKGSPLFAFFLSQSLSDGSYRPNWEKYDLLGYIFASHCDKRWGDSESSDFAWGRCPKLGDDHLALQIALLATLVKYVDCRHLIDNTGWGKIDEKTRRQALALVGGPIDGGPETIGNIIPALEPDILGEWFVLTGFEQGGDVFGLLDIACKIRPDAVAEFFVRATQDFPFHYSVGRFFEYEPRDHAVKEGLAFSALQRGMVYYHGTMGEKNIESAIEWFHVAADLGDPTAMLAIAACYDTGEGMNSDPAKATDWYRKSADAGNDDAMFALGYQYYLGENVEENLDLAIFWYEKSAHAGNVDAIFNLGLIYFLDKNENTDPSNAVLWFRKAADMGHIKSIVNLAGCYDIGFGVSMDNDVATKHLLSAARMGDAEAMFILGNRLFIGKVVNGNRPLAIKWFRDAANLGHGNAMARLGTCYFEGKGVSKNDEFSVFWIEKAARSGHVEAMFHLGVCYFEGIGGLEKDYVKASEWYKKSASAGYTAAMSNLGICYRDGLGVEVDHTLSLEWVRRAAEAGNSTAMFNLSIFYKVGTGVEVNLEESKMWRERAISAGYKPAK